MKKGGKRKGVKRLLWIIWAPLILIGIVVAIVITVGIIGIHNVEYGKDEYEISTMDYADLERFSVTSDYYLVADSSLKNIRNKVNEYIGFIYGNDGFNTSTIEKDKYIKLVVDESLGNRDTKICDYMYTCNGRNITIKGRDRDHLLRGALAFLEEFGGLRCYASDTIVATQSEITYPITEGGYTKFYSDYFEMLDNDQISAQNDDYSWFRGYNTNIYRFKTDAKQPFETDEEAEKRKNAQNAYYDSMGGSVQYISSFCHTFSTEFVNADKYYDSNPECFAVDTKGNRRHDELCLSSEKTLEIVTNEVFELLESKNYDPNAPIQIISLTQWDDLTACKCDECVTQAKAHGGYSYVNLKFVNEVAKAVKNRKTDSKGNPVDYSNVAIDTFAYRYTRSAPKDIVPEDNVIIRLCSIECCSSHYIDDEGCLANKAFMKDLSDWSKLTDRIYIWDYCTDFSYFVAPFPEIEVLAHNIRVFYENGVRGIYEEGNFTVNGNDKNLDKVGTEYEYTVKRKSEDTEFYELRAYVISKVMQDPYCDYEEVIKDFCKGYYGNAWESMYDIITLMDKYASRRHLNIYRDPKIIFKCSKDEFNAINELFDTARQEAGTSDETPAFNGESVDYLKHVKNSEICWRYYKMLTKKFEFKDKSSFERLSEELYKDIYNNHPNRLHEVDDYAFNNVLESAIIELRLLFDFVVGNFIYGP